MYGIIARTTRGLFHVKTAGTSYLEALRMLAICAPDEFQEIVEFVHGQYETDKTTCPMSATVDAVPGPTKVADPNELERLCLDR